MVGRARLEVAKSHRPALEAGEWLSRPLSLGDRNAARTELADVYKSLPATMGEAFLDACGRQPEPAVATPGQERTSG